MATTSPSPTEESSEDAITPLPEGTDIAPVRKSWLARLSMAEKASIVSILAILAVGWWALLHFLYRDHNRTGGADIEVAAMDFQFPLKGEVATISDIVHGWRDRAPGDKAKPQFNVLPYVRIKLDEGGASGYIRVWFIDNLGKEKGDIATLKVEGGNFKDMGRGEKVLSPKEAEIACTAGFESDTQYASYLANQDAGWTLKIEQGTDYSKGPWTSVGTSKLSNQK